VLESVGLSDSGNRLPEAGSRSRGTHHGTKVNRESRQGGKEGNLDRRKIHVVSIRRSVKNTNAGSAKRSGDTTDNVVEKKKIDVVRRQLKKALQELDQIEFEVKGGCTW
jgi:hypothetical protein